MSSANYAASPQMFQQRACAQEHRCHSHGKLREDREWLHDMGTPLLLRGKRLGDNFAAGPDAAARRAIAFTPVELRQERAWPQHV